MKTALLWCGVALGCLCAAAAPAQISVPLPQDRPGNRSTQPPSPAERAPIVPPTPREPRSINPFNRDIDLTVPLMFRDRSLGDAEVRITADDRLLVSTADFLRLVKPLINEEAWEALTLQLGGGEMFSAEALAPTGIELTFDAAALSVVILDVDPSIRLPQTLFETPSLEDETDVLSPAGVSGYLNLNVLSSYDWSAREATNPTFSLNGATRFGRIVLEGDGELTSRPLGFFDSGTSGYRFNRNYVRLVYDQPERFIRWFAGDLEPEIRGNQSFTRMGGVGATRQRRRFNDFRTGVLQIDRQLVLQRDATVRIVRNGTLFSEMRLEAGSYDFSSLPLLTGTNDIQVEIEDNSGFVQRLGYRTYLDPIDLEPGDHEFGFFVGATSRRFGSSPVYDGPLAFSGFYRKAPMQRPAFGIGLQASRDVQNIIGQTQFILPNASRLMLDGGASHSRIGGAGYALGASYDMLINRSTTIDTFTVRVDYLSRLYGGLGNFEPDNRLSWSLNAQYSRSFTQRLAINTFASVQGSRDGIGSSYRIGATTSYRLTPEWAIRGGVDYTRLPTRFESRRNGFGFNVSLLFQPSFRRRAEARYESSTRRAQLSYAQTGYNQINSLSFGGTVSRSPDDAYAQAYASYVANRFDASFSHAGYGSDIGRIGDRNVTTARMGTTLAFADGVFGVGRRINDSFAILYPHENLRGRSVVAGQSIANNEYVSKSGAFGGAVNNFLTSYVTQSVQYDVEDAPTGYDVGSGVVRVRPPYRSGFKLRVGTEAFVSAMGTLQRANGDPVSLAGGRVSALDGQDAEPIPFFTNSVGRFAVPNLRPGVRYRVELFGSGGMFEFDVPSDTTGLVNLNIVALGAAN